jgi:hypothetical protein
MFRTNRQEHESAQGFTKITRDFVENQAQREYELGFRAERFLLNSYQFCFLSNSPCLEP